MERVKKIFVSIQFDAEEIEVGELLYGVRSSYVSRRGRSQAASPDAFSTGIFV
jgi:hypothetical protein